MVTFRKSDKMKAKFSLKFLYCYVTSFGFFTGNFVLGTTGMVEVGSLNELCPYTDYCTSNATAKLEDDALMPCCGYCSCTDDCWRRGNCCPDKLNIIPKQPIETCETVLVKSSIEHHIGNSADVLRFFVTKSCPTAESDLSDMCRGKVQSSLEDFTWVTDKRTNKIYHNKHCAECHGVVDYTPWQLSTDCTEAMNGQYSPNEIVNNIIKNCSLVVIPPLSTEEYMSRCFQPEITKCNMTGNWQTPDQDIESACSSISQNYLETFFGWTTVYKNVYCFLCNSRHEQQLFNICPADVTYKKSGLFNGLMAVLDFTNVIDFKENGVKDSIVDGPVCNLDEFEDPFQHKCLKLSCPMLQAPVHGKCVKLVTETRLLGLQVSFLLHPIWDHTTITFDQSTYDISDIARNLIPKIRRELGLTNGKCQVCYEAIHGIYDEDKFPKKFLVSTNFHTAEECQTDFIIDRMDLLLRNELKVQFGAEYVTFAVYSASSDEFKKFNADDMYIMTYKPCPTYDLLDLQKFSVCPSVSLNYETYVKLMKQTSDQSQRQDINIVFDLKSQGSDVVPDKQNFTAQVCLESYLSILPTNSIGVAVVPVTLTLLAMNMIYIKCID